MMTSETSFGSTWARRSASAIATSPSLCAGRLPSPPLNAPTGVRAALAMTMSVIEDLLTGLTPMWAAVGECKSVGRREFSRAHVAACE